MPKRNQDKLSVDFQALFTAAPEPYLVLDPEFIILLANDAYLRATMTSLDAIVGRYVFEVFSDNPDNARAMAVTNTRASLERVVATGKPDTVPIQRYDIPSADSDTGFEKRYWSPVNTPVFDEQGDLVYLIHRVEDVTDFVQAKEARAEQMHLLEERTLQFEAEMFARARELQQLNNALREVNAHRDLVLDSVAEAIVALDSEWRITYLNHNAARQVEAEREELMGRVIWELFPLGRTGTLRRQLQEKMDLRQSGQFDHFNEASQRWTENTVYPSLEGLVLFSTDVTERKQVEQHLQKMRARLHSAIRVAQLGFWEMELESRTVYFSPESKLQLGYEDGVWPDSVEAWRSRMHPDDSSKLDQVLDHYFEGAEAELELECRLKHKDGSYRWLHARFISMGDDHETRRILVTHLDVTERKLRTEQLKRSAYHDALTGLPNRAMIYSYVQDLIAWMNRAGGAFAVLFLDLDRFKPINDRYGHAMGDLVLKIISERLATSVRAGDFVGRLAGDEFIIVLPDLSSKEAAASVAQHTLNIMGQPFQIEGHELHVTPSIGISLFPCNGETVDTLIHSADAAMYSAKQGGRNSYCFFEFTQHWSMNSVVNDK